MRLARRGRGAGGRGPGANGHAAALPLAASKKSATHTTPKTKIRGQLYVTLQCRTLHYCTGATCYRRITVYGFTDLETGARRTAGFLPFWVKYIRDPEPGIYIHISSFLSQCLALAGNSQWAVLIKRIQKAV